MTYNRHKTAIFCHDNDNMLQDVTCGDFVTMESLVLVDGEIQTGSCATAVDRARTIMRQNEAKGNRKLANAGLIRGEIMVFQWV